MLNQISNDYEMFYDNCMCHTYTDFPYSKVNCLNYLNPSNISISVNKCVLVEKSNIKFRLSQSVMLCTPNDKCRGKNYFDVMALSSPSGVDRWWKVEGHTFFPKSENLKTKQKNKNSVDEV